MDVEDQLKCVLWADGVSRKKLYIVWKCGFK